MSLENRPPVPGEPLARLPAEQGDQASAGAGPRTLDFSYPSILDMALNGLTISEIVIDLNMRGLDVYADVVYTLAATHDAVELAAREGWLHANCSPVDCRLAAIRHAFGGEATNGEVSSVE